MDKKRKILISVMLILIIIIIVLLFVLLKSMKNNENNDTIPNIETTNIVNEEIISENNKITNVEIYKIRDCISIYLSAINQSNPVYYTTNENGELVRNVSDETINENIYPYLSQNYINKNNITITNLDNYVEKLNKSAIFDVLDIRRYMNNNSYQYVVYGMLTDTDYNFINYAYYNVYIDLANNLFAIEPILTDINDISEIEQQNVIIEKNDYNDIPTNNLTQEDVLKEVLNTYKRLMLANPDLAYEYLDDKYKEKKFENIDNFKNYINNNKETLAQVRLNQYSYTSYDDYNQLICVDQNEHYYIFNETEPLNYKVMLDTYTADLPKFIEEYNKASSSKKVQLNIQKFFDAIADGDYRYAYNKLDETYRSNNFPTQADFENYVKSTFYAKNKLGYTSDEKNGDLYIYKMVITNSEDESQGIEKQFVVKLLEGTDFVMSFEK